jgi:sec-independent protein translocase protein TatC
MALGDHLSELRTRLLICVGTVVVMMIPAWFLYPWITDILNQPYCDAVRNVEPEASCKFLETNLLEPFTLRLRIAGYGALFLSMPVMLWQLWRFVAPGLYKRERRYALAFTLSMFMMLAFGVGFQFPVLVVALQMVGVVTPQRLASWRRQIIVVIVVLAAGITPSGDPISMLALAVPMYLFFELSLLIGRLFLWRRARREDAPAADSADSADAADAAEPASVDPTS